MTPPSGPTHDLAALQALVAEGKWVGTHSAMRDVAALELDPTDVADCVCSMTSANFYKTMPSEKVVGSMQDVYRTNYAGLRIYLKVELTKKAVVISFKKDDSR